MIATSEEEAISVLTNYLDGPGFSGGAYLAGKVPPHLARRAGRLAEIRSAVPTSAPLLVRNAIERRIRAVDEDIEDEAKRHEVSMDPR